MSFATPRPTLHPVRYAALALACALTLLPALSRAQSLRELYDAARAYDATYLAARALADSAQYRLAQAAALNRPNVGLAANAQRRDVDVPSTVTGPNRTPIPLTAGHFYNNSVDATISAGQPPHKRNNDAVLSPAQRAYDVSMADLETAEQDLIIRVAQAYFDVLAAYDALVTSQTSKAAIAEQLASAKRNFEVGTATITDTREAQARYDLSTANEIAAENDLRTRRIVLDQLVGRTNVQPNPLAVPVKLPPVLPADAEAWVNRAWVEHPAIERAQLAFDVAKLETEKAKAGHLPTVDLVGSYGPQHANGALANFPGNSTTGSVGVQLNLPLFAGFA